MIRLCKKRKIDLVLTKSISRFARNTVDCLNYIRVLKELGIAVIFEKENINAVGGAEWTITSIRGILKNEKYCGDVLLQKTFVTDCISGKVMKNTGQLPMYLIQNHHEGIVPRETFDAVQTEMARRNAGKSPSRKNSPTGLTSYASKYVLSERLVCGECGTLYRRCTWSRDGKKRVVWRCVSRLDYGKKYCHASPTMEEEPLQRSILAAINSAMGKKSDLIRQITGAMESELIKAPNGDMTIAEIDTQLETLTRQFQALLSEAAIGGAEDYTEQFKEIADQSAALKERKRAIEQKRCENSEETRRIANAVKTMEQTASEITQWEESVIRQLVDTVKVISKDEIIVYLRGGMEIRQEVRR